MVSIPIEFPETSVDSRPAADDSTWIPHPLSPMTELQISTTPPAAPLSMPTFRLANP
jgi:hypothetical protein